MTVRGYHVKQRKGMGHWEPILEEWLLGIERFCRVTGGDEAPYWYNERSNIGVLAGAAWRCGRVALEEFQYVKGFKNKPKWLGRADLWLASDDHKELVEAKFRWCSLRSRNGITNIANETLELAALDAKKTRGGDLTLKAIGVAFVPFYTKNVKIEELAILIESAISNLKSSDYHAIAWCFPRETRHSKSSQGNYLPGVAILAKNVD